MEKEHAPRIGPGRRKYPESDFAAKCPFCDIKERESEERWAALKEQRHDRKVECEKELERIKVRIDTVSENMIGKYWGRIVVVGIMLAVGYVGYQQHWAFISILKNQENFQITMNSFENKQIGDGLKLLQVEGEIKKLQERQDILRDMNIKILENQKSQ